MCFYMYQYTYVNEKYMNIDENESLNGDVDCFSDVAVS